MNNDLGAALPGIMPSAIAWAERCAIDIAQTGNSLNDLGISVARRVGVCSPERIRIKFVDKLPIPDDPTLQKTVLAAGLLGDGMVGLLVRLVSVQKVELLSKITLSLAAWDCERSLSRQSRRRPGQRIQRAAASSNS